FLVEYFEQFNKEFSIDFNSIKSVFEKQLTLEEINLHLSILHERIIDKGHCIKFENNYYLPLDKHGKDLYLKPKTQVDILKSLDGKTYLSLENEVYDIRILELHEKKSKEFDYMEEEKPKKKEKYIPPADHPWKKNSFRRYLEKNSPNKEQLIEFS
ncbi:MAG: hypothetical protein ACRC0S_09410, partial [Fusobacteriaceae bacterium]